MVCQRLFSARLTFEYHIRQIHSDSGEVSCDRCEDKFADFPHKCDECCEVFKRKNDLVNHVQGEHRGKRFSCNLCDKSIPY